MSITVAVRTRVVLVDDLPTFRLGLAAACARAGLTVDEPDHLGPWAQHRDVAAIVTLGRCDGWTALKTIRASSPTATVLGLLPCCDIVSYREALEAGATAVAAHDSDPDHLVSTLITAVQGQVVLPVELVTTLVERLPVRGAERAAVLNELDLELLRLLNKGETVTAIARRLHMAPRTIDRRLQNMYLRMGVQTRLQAVAWAAYWRVLQPWV
jgi:DNA-binding NarL/FixJ family response regulator